MTVQCPVCTGDSRVARSDQVDGTMRRRRMCLACGARWWTAETLFTPHDKRRDKQGSTAQLRTPGAIARAVAARRRHQDANLALRREIPLDAVADYREIMKRGIPAAEAAEIVRNSYQQRRT